MSVICLLDDSSVSEGFIKKISGRPFSILHFKERSIITKFNSTQGVAPAHPLSSCLWNGNVILLMESSMKLLIRVHYFKGPICKNSSDFNLGLEYDNKTCYQILITHNDILYVNTIQNIHKIFLDKLMKKEDGYMCWSSVLANKGVLEWPQFLLIKDKQVLVNIGMDRKTSSVQVISCDDGSVLSIMALPYDLLIPCGEFSSDEEVVSITKIGNRLVRFRLKDYTLSEMIRQDNNSQISLQKQGRYRSNPPSFLDSHVFSCSMFVHQNLICVLDGEYDFLVYDMNGKKVFQRRMLMHRFRECAPWSILLNESRDELFQIDPIEFKILW